MGAHLWQPPEGKPARPAVAGHQRHGISRAGVVLIEESERRLRVIEVLRITRHEDPEVREWRVAEMQIRDGCSSNAGPPQEVSPAPLALPTQPPRPPPSSTNQSGAASGEYCKMSSLAGNIYLDMPGVRGSAVGRRRVERGPARPSDVAAHKPWASPPACTLPARCLHAACTPPR